MGTPRGQVAVPKPGLHTYCVTLDELPALLCASVLIRNMGIVKVKVK